MDNSDSWDHGYSRAKYNNAKGRRREQDVMTGGQGAIGSVRRVLF